MKNKLEAIEFAIDVWTILLPDIQSELAACMELLDGEERERANRFTRNRDAERFVLCRGVRRRILGDYLDQDPKTLRFGQNQNGKPHIGDGRLSFNASHSRDRLLIAVTSGRSVGVDIEFRREGVPMDEIARRWFAAEECTFFQTLENQQNAFFDIWARKEAYVKALGTGIFKELSSFCVPLECADGFPESGRNDAWIFQSLEIDPAYAAAVVFEAPAVPVEIRSLRPNG